MILLTIDDVALGFGVTRREVRAAVDRAFGREPRRRELTIDEVASITPSLRRRLSPRGETQREDIAHA